MGECPRLETNVNELRVLKEAGHGLPGLAGAGLEDEVRGIQQGGGGVRAEALDFRQTAGWDDGVVPPGEAVDGAGEGEEAFAGIRAQDGAEAGNEGGGSDPGGGAVEEGAQTRGRVQAE